MGQAKMLLPWGETTVLGQVVATIAAAGIEDILVVTGGEREGVEAEILALPANQTPRDFINAPREDILYLPVETDSILLDVDTPEDHERLKPRA